MNKGWFQQLDVDPSPIHKTIKEHTAPHTHPMLGSYFEALWCFYLSEYPTFKLIAKNRQVIEQGRTLGEFDFIYQSTASNATFHLEVAVKYYLGIPEPVDSNKSEFAESSHLNNWVGPGGRDRLDKKANKLFGSQQALSLTPAGKKSLNELGIVNVTTETCILGYLFYPWKVSMRPPHGVNANHNRGHWLRQSQLHELLAVNNHWLILDKPLWLAQLPAEPSNYLSNNDLSAFINRHFEKSKRPLLIERRATSTPQVNSGTKLTHERYFIVNDHWPNKS